MMIAAPSAWRWKMVGLGVVILAFSALDGWFGASDLLHLTRGLSKHRQVITSAPYFTSMLMIAVAGASIGVVFLLAKQATPEAQKNVSRQSFRRAGWYLVFLLVCIVAALLAPVPQHRIVDHLATQRGYLACPTPDRPRHQPDRWALPGPHGPHEHCPGEGADPNV